jgi:peptidoglycan-associated lipoprotein
MLALSGCHKKKPVPPPPPPPPPAAAQPTASTSGTQNVSPHDSTTYTITATGPGGNAEASTEVTVNREVAPAPAAPSSLTEAQLFEQQVKDIYFDYDRYDLKPADQTTIEQDASLLNKYSDIDVVIGGHCDDRGSEEYNIALGQNRAEAVKNALVADGIPASRIRVISYGKEKPFCTVDDDECWHENRRAHFKVGQ